MSGPDNPVGQLQFCGRLRRSRIQSTAPRPNPPEPLQTQHDSIDRGIPGAVAGTRYWGRADKTACVTASATRQSPGLRSRLRAFRSVRTCSGTCRPKPEDMKKSVG